MGMMAVSLVLKRSMRFVADLIRSMPFLLLAYILYYVLPEFSIRLSSWTTGLLALVIYNTAYFAEILRGAWSHLPADQEEAAKAFGYSRPRRFVRIIAPQILIGAAPVLGNQMIAIIKDSALLMIITIPELTFAANSVQSRYFIPLESLILAAALYWMLCRGIEVVVGRLERVTAIRGT
jgi:polar amino acid transport system permease protein